MVVMVPVPERLARPEDTCELAWLIVMLSIVPDRLPPANVTPDREAFANTQLLVSVSDIGTELEIMKFVTPAKFPLPTPVAESEPVQGEPPPRQTVRFPLPLLLKPIVPEPFKVRLTEPADAERASKPAHAATPSSLTAIFIILPPIEFCLVMLMQELANGC